MLTMTLAYSSSTGSNIKLFMAHYRQNFPEATILPKMHLLEDHVVPWLRRWHVGFGFMGEQGAESIHASFNQIARAYVGVRGRVEQFKLTVEAHHQKINPSDLVLRPTAPKKKKSVAN